MRRGRSVPVNRGNPNSPPWVRPGAARRSKTAADGQFTFALGSEKRKFGGTDFLSNYVLTVVVYDDSVRAIEGYIADIKQKMINNSKSFFYISFIKPISIGPKINSKETKNEILQRNIDFQIMFDVESAE